jgi:Fe-S-cluster-containing hydrogenase component 2
VDACPIGAVGFHGGHPLFCDLCGGSPACVAACPTGALDYREDYRDVSLDGYPATGGNPARKRAHFCGERGAQLRAAWESGSRIDS